MTWAISPPATDPPSIATPVTVWPLASTASRPPGRPLAASASASHASVAPLKKVNPNPSAADATSHHPNGAAIAHIA